MTSRDDMEERRLALGVAMAESSLDKVLADLGKLVEEGELPDDEVLHGSFSYRVSVDRLTVFLDLFPPSEDGEPLESLSIFQALREHGIDEVLEENVISAVSECNRERKALQRVVAAQGVPPKPSKDGSIRYNFPFREKGSEMVDEEKKVDYKDRGTIIFVDVGEELAYVDPPEEGEPGKDVYGRQIPVKPPKRFSLSAGKGVECVDGRVFKATVQGQPVLRGQEISVREVYVVPGDVNLTTGNVNFFGSVMVGGNVAEGFSIVCGGDLEIRGTAESVDISVGGNARINSIIGKNSRVDVKGSLEARFIQGGEIKVGEDVVVGSYVLHSYLQAGGSVTVRGRKGIIGGHVVALDKIDTTVAGAPMGTVTVLEVGVMAHLKAELADLESRIDKGQDVLNRIYQVVKAILPRFKAGYPVPSSMKERLKIVQDKKEALTDAIQGWKGREMVIRRQMAQMSGAFPTISVRQKVYPGVEIVIYNARKSIREELRFITFSRDVDNNRIKESPCSR
ncbi:protein of unknown function DUF342 [Dethiosulfovibrio peptidovorans DSM 11002]|uniref:Flagellar Assembly Protein A N-terminal region domain-containing protein n=1 Tax=Dethiosulfovibrio peptidovorans DSM 11002 TaxID=469381 RepID=D2Z862_9BACT|nr:FapA family protein [Dethiosulfovibrio peptidovorans]EFC91659.1 protein of unknown function DUF342 [Dethiosulfovibrio peptidovorans DSM 11002]